jgi:hypothetical protein
MSHAHNGLSISLPSLPLAGQLYLINKLDCAEAEAISVNGSGRDYMATEEQAMDSADRRSDRVPPLEQNIACH